MEQVLLDFKEEGYARITLHRPEKLNSISKQVTKELREALHKVKQHREDLKFLVITGSGDRAFCAGGDLNELHGDLNEEEAYAVLHPMKEVLYEIATFPIPTIALLNGQARGGGCEIATSCDFRYGVDTAAFGFVQGNLGITPGWGGGVLLHKRIKPDFAFHWLMDADMYDAHKTEGIGWLHKRCTKEQLNSQELFQSFLNKTPEQARLFKKQYKTEILPEDLSDRMDQEVRQCSRLWETEEHKEAVRKFIHKRKN